MKKRNLLICLLGLVLTVGAFTGCKGVINKKNTDAKQETNTQNNSAQSDTGEIFMDMKTVDIKGEEVTTKDFEDKKLIMINGWATWCGPCVSEIPGLAKLAEEYDKTGEVAIMGLLIETDATTGAIRPGLSEEERKAAEDILKTSEAEYRQLLVSEDMVAKLSKIEGFPTTFFVDGKGNPAGEPVLGSRTEEQWKKIIAERLKLVK